MSKQPPYERVQPADDLVERAERARRYMGRMAALANMDGMLGSETLVGLQRPSQSLPDGVPAMVRRRDSEGVWYAAEWSEPDAVSADSVRPEPDVRQSEASVRVEPGLDTPDEPGFDKKAYQRDYMRERRAKAKRDEP